MTVTGDVLQTGVPGLGPYRARSYEAYVGGRDVPGAGWVHTVHANAWLTHLEQAATMQAELDGSGLAEPLIEHPWVVGRTAWVELDVVEAALEAAAQAAPLWAGVDRHHRLALIDRLSEALTELSGEFVDMLTAEGHPARLARWELAGMLRNVTGANLTYLREQLWRQDQHGEHEVVLRRQPDGVVCINPPANAPAPIAAIAAVAIAVGNTVVVRVPRTGPLATMWLLRDVLAPMVEELGAPPGTLNVICAEPGEALERMVSSDHVNDVLYFGATRRVEWVRDECVARGKKPILEGAGNDSLVVWRDADLDGAADAAAEAFLGSGQICMLPNVVVAHPEIANALAMRIVARAVNLRPGLPTDEDTVLAVVRQQARYFQVLEEIRADPDAEVLCGGTRLDLDGRTDDAGLFLAPTVVRVNGLAGARRLSAVAEETFFPLLPIVVPTEDEAADEQRFIGELIAWVNSDQYGLRRSLWTSSEELIQRWDREVTTGGIVTINAGHTSMAEGLPTNGGTGRSGGDGAQLYALELTHLQGRHRLLRTH